MPLLAWLFAVSVPFLVWLLKAFGIGLVVYTGLNLLLTSARDQIFTLLGGTGQWAVAMMGIGGIDEAIMLTFSALITRTLLIGFSSAGTGTRWRTGAPPA